MSESSGKLINKYFRYAIPQVVGVVHIGSHLYQELTAYRRLGIQKIMWVDGCTEDGEVDDQVFVKAIVADTESVRPFYVSGNSDGGSSSLFSFKEILDVYNGRIYVKEVIQVHTQTLDGIFDKRKIDIGDYNAIIMHTNGADLLILDGAKDILENIDYVGVYYYWKELYSGVPFEKDVDDYMEKIGFVPVHKLPWKNGYGNGLYKRAQ
jgi:hypothetical protein